MEKLCKMSLSGNLQCRNCRGFPLWSAGDKGRAVCAFTCQARWHLLVYWGVFLPFQSHPSSPLAVAAHVASYIWLEIRICDSSFVQSHPFEGGLAPSFFPLLFSQKIPSGRVLFILEECRELAIWRDLWLGIPLLVSLRRRGRHPGEIANCSPG